MQLYPFCRVRSHLGHSFPLAVFCNALFANERDTSSVQWELIMTVADHFDHIPDGAFVRGYDSGIARRQFNLSIVMFALFCVVCAMIGLVRFGSPDTLSSTASGGVPPTYAGHL